MKLALRIAAEPTAAGQLFKFSDSIDLVCLFEIQRLSTKREAFTNVKFENAVQNQKLTLWDISVPGADIGKAFEAIQGESFTCVLCPDGRVTDVRGMDKVAAKASKVLSNSAGIFQSMVIEPLQTQLAATLSDAAMENVWSLVLNIYPDGPVSPGGAWTKSRLFNAEVSLGASLCVVDSLGLKRVNSKTVEISQTSSAMSARTETHGSEPTAFQITDLKGDGDGTFELYTENGWVRTGDIRRAFSGVIGSSAGIPFLKGSSVNVIIQTHIETSAVAQ